MSPDAEKAIVEALNDGASVRQAADRAGVSKSTAQRVKKEHGIATKRKAKAPAKPKPRKRDTARDSKRDTDGTAGVPEKRPAPREQPRIEDRLEFNTKVGSRAVTAAQRMIEWALSRFPIGADGEPVTAGIPLNERRLAADILKNAQNSVSQANLMIRLNAGLPTSYEKGETETRGTVKHEYDNPDRVSDAFREALGIDLGRTADGVHGVSEEVAGSSGAN